jgi:hypothetical protein
MRDFNMIFSSEGFEQKVSKSMLRVYYETTSSKCSTLHTECPRRKVIVSVYLTCKKLTWLLPDLLQFIPIDKRMIHDGMKKTVS